MNSSFGMSALYPPSPVNNTQETPNQNYTANYTPGTAKTAGWFIGAIILLAIWYALTEWVL